MLDPPQSRNGKGFEWSWGYYAKNPWKVQTWLSCLEETGDTDTGNYLCPSGGWGWLQCSGTAQCFWTALKMDPSNPCYRRKPCNRAKVDRKGLEGCAHGPWAETTASAEKGERMGVCQDQLSLPHRN